MGLPGRPRTGRLGLDAGVSDLARLLRERTGQLHADVELALGLPGSVRSRSDYVDVLERFLDLHQHLEQRLADPRWSERWAELDVDLAVHRRAHLLHDDLTRLGVTPRPRDVAVPGLDAFGGALGGLYVLEGSALGGRVLAPALRAAVGDVPTAFLAGEGRPQARAWQSVRTALRRAPASLGDDAVRGARAVFAAFDAHLSSAARHRLRPAGADPSTRVRGGA